MNHRLLVLGLIVATISCHGGSNGIYQAAALRKIYGGLPVSAFLGRQASKIELRRDYAAGMLTDWSSSTLGVPAKAPNPRTDIRQIGVMRSYLDGPALIDFATDFPEGQGAIAWRFSANPAAVLQPGFYTFAYMNLRDKFPAAVEDRYFQYAFVWDRDGDRGNNYQGAAPYDLDYFNGSDTWFQFQKQLNHPWTFTAQNARGGTVTNWASEAVLLACDDIIMMMIYDEEFVDLLYSGKFRATAFEHGGDYGAAPPHDWFGSVRPERDQFLFAPSWDAIREFEPQVRIEAKIVQADLGYLGNLGIALDPLASYADYDAFDYPVRNREDDDLVLRSELLGGLSGEYQYVPKNLDFGLLTTRVGLSSADLFTGWNTLPGLRSFAVSNKSAIAFSGSLTADYSIPFLPSMSGDNGDMYGKLGDDALSNLVSSGAGASAFAAPVLRLFDGQRGVIQLRDRMAMIDNLEPGFRAEIEPRFPDVSSVITGPVIDIQPFVQSDRKIALMLRLDTRGFALESNETINVAGRGTTYLDVPFLEHGRTFLSGITVESGQTLLLGGVQDSGSPSITEGVPYLAEIPVLNRLFAPPQHTVEDKPLFLTIRATLVMPSGL